MFPSVHMARVSKYQTENTAFPAIQNEWRAGLYIRLSREDGDKIESESVSSQRAMLEQFASARPDIFVHDYYIDDGWSGTDFDRPSFGRMLSDITSKRINCVIVKDLSRFGRNYVEAGKYLETVFPLFKVRFIAVNDQIDSAVNPQSLNNVIVPFKNIMNDEYCRDISVKVRSALHVRRKQGTFIGSFAAYGYAKDENDHNKLVIDEEAAATVRAIYEKFLSGHSILSIARELNAQGVLNPSAYKNSKGLNCNRSGALWCDATVRRILTNEIYIGNLIQKKNQTISHKIHLSKSVSEGERIKVQGTHEAIIPEDDFQKVQSLLKRDTRISPNAGKLSLFAGFLKCADCGRAMQKRTVKQPYKTYDYYVCSTHKKLKSACTKHQIRADLLEAAVLEAVNGYIALAADFDEVLKRMNEEERKSGIESRLQAGLTAKRKELEKAQRILLDLYPDYKCGVIGKEQYLILKEKYENPICKFRAAIEEEEREIENRKNGAEGRNGFIETFKKYRGLKALTREIVTELIDNIYIHEDGEIELCLKCKNELSYAEQYLKEVRERL